MAAHVELPDFVDLSLVEFAYRRSVTMQDSQLRLKTQYAAEWGARGVRLARRRDARLLKFLDQACEHVWKWAQWQKSRFKQEGFDNHQQVSGEFTEESTWRQAYQLADQGERDAGAQLEIFQWIYGACAEAVYGPL